MDDAPPPDFTHLPSGEREWPDFIDQVAAAGDFAERHFIELKSDIDPTGKEGAAKVAKFILGAAHRDPDRAAKYLDGYGVMLLGVAKDEVRGLSRFEAKDLVGAVQQYIGEPGPRWDFVRVRVDDDRDVIVIKVDPPQPGVWPCCREGVGLNDGRIYIRADGETREANHDEVRALFQRSQAGAAAPRPELVVGLSGGAAHRFSEPASALDDYIAAERERLEAFAPSSDDEEQSAALGADRFLNPSVGGIFAPTEQPDDRDREEYLKEIDEWEAAIRAAWPHFVSHVSIAISDATYIEACSQRYLADVKIKIRLDGPVRAIQIPDDDDDFAELPEPPRPWGPTTVYPIGANPNYLADLVSGFPQTSTWIAPALFSRYDSIDIDNSNSVELEVLVEELRPGDPYLSSEALFLYVPFDHDGPITGTWTATAKDHHEMHSGEVRIEVEELTDLTEPLHTLLYALPQDEEGD